MVDPTSLLRPMTFTTVLPVLSATGHAAITASLKSRFLNAEVPMNKYFAIIIVAALLGFAMPVVTAMTYPILYDYAMEE